MGFEPGKGQNDTDTPAVCWVICDGLPVCVGTHKLRPCNSSELLAWQCTKDTLPTTNRYVDARNGDYETQKPATQRQQDEANDIMSDMDVDGDLDDTDVEEDKHAKKDKDAEMLVHGSMDARLGTGSSTRTVTGDGKTVTGEDLLHPQGPSAPDASAIVSNRATAGSSSRTVTGKSPRAADRRRSRSRSPITEDTSLAEVGRRVSKMVKQGKVSQQTTPHGVQTVALLSRSCHGRD